MPTPKRSNVDAINAIFETKKKKEHSNREPLLKRLNVEIENELFTLIKALAFYKRRTNREIVEEAIHIFSGTLGKKTVKQAEKSYEEEMNRKKK